MRQGGAHVLYEFSSAHESSDDYAGTPLLLKAKEGTHLPFRAFSGSWKLSTSKILQEFADRLETSEGSFVAVVV